MIEADRDHLQAETQQLTIKIRLKELNMFLGNIQSIATQSTFMIGLAFSML